MATPPVLSTTKSRAHKPRRFEFSPLQKQLFLGFGLLLMLGLLGLATWYLTRISALQIHDVTVAGGFTISHEAIEGAVWNELNGTYFRLIPKRFAYFYPEEAIRTTLESFPRMKQVHVERAGKTIAVAFEEYEPYALWCKNDDDETCLFIDSNGYAFSEAPELTGSAFLRFRKGNEEPTLRTNVFTREFLHEVVAFSETLERELSLYVTHIHTEGDYDVNFRISGGGLIKVSQIRPFSESLANLRSILASEEFAHIEPGNFQYIDLRFGDKVFVNEESTVATTSSSSQPEIMSLTESLVAPTPTAGATSTH